MAGGADSGRDETHPETTPSEIRSWIAYDFANSIYSTVAIGGFMPLLLQEAALRQAGFPRSACANIVTNATLAREIFPNGDTDTMYRIKDYTLPACQDPDNPSCARGFCQGLPGNADECLDPTGTDRVDLSLPFGAGTITPTGYASLFISISVAVQVVVFISLGALTDHAGWRKHILFLSTVVGGVATVACIGVWPASWWLGGFLMIISNVAFGLSIVVYNAFLPLLVEAHPAVRCLTDATERYTRGLRLSSDWSNKGFAAGYVSGVVGIALVVPFAFLLDALAAYQAANVIAGLVWIGVGIYALRGLHPRPGPPLPPKPHWLVRSWVELFHTLRHASRLRTTLSYLLLWFVFSDATFVISSVGALFANSEVSWGCLPRSLGITILFLLVPLTAAAGNMGMLWLVKRYHWTPKTAIIISLLGLLTLPLYGLVGFLTDSFGLHFGWETLLLGAVFGFFMAPMQGFSRALFGTLIPQGQEGQLMGLYEITDKGSSWIGPLVIAALAETVGIRYGFLYVFFGLLIPVIFLIRLDVEAGAREAAAFSLSALVETVEAGKVSPDAALELPKRSAPQHLDAALPATRQPGPASPEPSDLQPLSGGRESTTPTPTGVQVQVPHE